MLGLADFESAPAVGALRRPAAARRRGALARARARGAAVRRAAVESRRQAAPPRARGDPRAAAGALADRAVRDARPGGGARGLRSHHRDERSARSRSRARPTSCTRRRRAAFSPTSSAMPIWSTASSPSTRDGASFAAGGITAPVRAQGLPPVPRRSPCARSGCASSTPRRACCPASASAWRIWAAASNTSSRPRGASCSCSTGKCAAPPPRRRGRRRVRSRRGHRAAAVTNTLNRREHREHRESHQNIRDLGLLRALCVLCGSSS